MIELNDWILNFEKGIISCIELSKQNLEANNSNNEKIIEEFESLFLALNEIYRDNRSHYEYMLKSINLNKEYSMMINMEKLLQKLFNSIEYIDNCISNELLHSDYIETLSLIWRYS